MSANGPGEILTLQFGHYSNFVGTHFWNFQEKSFKYSNNSEPEVIDHDVLYREGTNDKGQVTFTPRALIVDLKGSLRTLSQASPLYEHISKPSEIEVHWEADKIEIDKADLLHKNKFQQDIEKEETDGNELSYDLEEDVEVWSDYIYTRFHPRTLNIIKEYQHGKDTNFNTFPAGRELWKSEQFEDGFSDKIRNYIEECDYFQGFQILLDAVDGFSGLSSSCIEYLNDEYGRSTVTFPLIPSYYPDHNFVTEEERHQSLIKDSTRVLNLAFCFNALKENASLLVPLCTGKDGWRHPGEKREFHHTCYRPELYYHSSGILAAALDTFSLKYRLKTNNYSLSDLSCDLTQNNRTAAAASLCLPFSFNIDAELIDCLDNWTGPLTQTLTPKCSLGTDHMVQLYTIRGIPEERLKKLPSKAGLQKQLPAYKCASVKEMFEFYLTCTTFGSINNVTVVNNSLSVVTPFPKVFDDLVGYNGNIIALPRPPSIDVHAVPVMAGLHNGAGVGEMLESLHTETKKLKFGKFHQFKDAGMEMDDFVQCLDDLFDFRERYEESYYL